MVEFLPPAFRNPETDTNEEMELYLVDEDTKDETNHVSFVYYSVKGNRSDTITVCHCLSRKFNLYHCLGKFGRQQIDDIFLAHLSSAQDELL